MIYTGQACQDLFALEIIGKNGTYIEIGACSPKITSNSYTLEVYNNWRGISIEIDKYRMHEWDQHKERKNKIYWENALYFNYSNALLENNIPLHVNYVSCDIEPPNNTFLALQRVIEQGITFDCLTFEHDLYTSPIPDYNIIATEYLHSKGYKPAVINVYDITNKNSENHFETWYVKNTIDYPTIDFKNWMNKILL